MFGADLVIPGEEELGVFANNSTRTRQLLIQGSDIQGSDRDPRAWLADFFYLPRDYDSIVSMRPRINNILIEFDLYVGLDGVLRGTYIRAHGPFVHSRWDLNMIETIENPGTVDHPTGYFATAFVPRSSLVETFESFMNGAIPDTLVGNETLTGDGLTSGAPHSFTIDPTIIFQPLRFARLSRLNRHRNGFADLRFEMGWNVWQSEERHAGVSINFAAPTGPRNDPTYLFNPIIGNGQHWEIGGSITTSRILWSGVDGENHFGISFDTNITYKLEEPQIRTFELKGLPNGVYMLASKFGPNPDEMRPTSINEGVAGLTTGAPPCSVDVPARQFALEYAPVANLTTLNVNIGADIQADFVLMFNVTSCGFIFDLGYNFWINRGENIGCPAGRSDCAKNCDNNGLCADSQKNTWALKGDARMFGYKDNVPTGMIATEDEPIALSATQSNVTKCTSATIHNGRNAGIEKQQTLLNAMPALDRNIHIDNFQEAGLKEQPDPNNQCVRLVRFPQDSEPINTSVDPIFLKCSDIDFVEIRSKSHKFFAHLGFNRERDNYVPNIGIGAFVEIGKNNNKSTLKKNTCGKTSRVEATASFWGVWLKGGVSF